MLLRQYAGLYFIGNILKLFPYGLPYTIFSLNAKNIRIFCTVLSAGLPFATLNILDCSKTQQKYDILYFIRPISIPTIIEWSKV